MEFEIVYSPEFLRFYEKGHPECPERVEVIYNYLVKKGVGNFVQPDLLNENILILAHSNFLIESVKKNEFFEPGTPNISDIYKYAFLAVCGSVKAVEISLNTDKTGIFLGRPPGHHVGYNFLGGFCYFNNIAVAVKKIMKENKKVAVFDIDGHHGNGTEDVLKMEKDVIFVSLHQYPAFPGTGITSFENCHNFPIAPGTSNKKYMEKFRIAIDIIKKFSPDIIGISLGLDTHKRDPLLALNFCLKEVIILTLLGVHFIVL